MTFLSRQKLHTARCVIHYINVYNIELSHWYKVDKVFYTPKAKLRCVKSTSYITKRS